MSSQKVDFTDPCKMSKCYGKITKYTSGIFKETFAPLLH